jgi:YD repeat-containing protein
LYNDTLLHSLGAFRISNYPTEIHDDLSFISGMECTIRDYIIAHNSGFPTPPIFGTYDYYIQTGVSLPTKVTETNFFPSPVTRITENKYDNGNKKYVTSTILKDNTTTLNTKRFKYPYDFSESVYSSMTAKNMINHVIEVTEEKNTSIQKTKTDFRDWGNNIFAPEYILTARGTDSYESRIKFGGYDYNGNILTESKANDVNANYIWGYNQSYPLAEIKGVSYDEFSAMRPTPNLNLLEAGDDTEQQRIRNALPKAMITFYTYLPLVGMTSQTDPNGQTTYYEYDSFGRLKDTKDKDQKVLKHYEYHYYNQQ